MRYRLSPLLLPVAIVMLLMTNSVAAATQFASPAFMQRWQQDETITPNFWGPLANARDGQHEPYAEGQAAAICTPDMAACSRAIIAGQRTVQYFDKGRMELTTPGGPVTSGLLVVEMMTGRIQTGLTAFEQRTPAAVPVAGDPSNTLYYRDIAIATYAKPQIGQLTQNVLNVTSGGSAGNCKRFWSRRSSGASSPTTAPTRTPSRSSSAMSASSTTPGGTVPPPNPARSRRVKASRGNGCGCTCCPAPRIGVS
ncbi:MAG: hypothetical protein LC793_17835 [Thermomicrobia bacterium]|nr:hypothetical protein [Thermomicrobia bacterium]